MNETQKTKILIVGTGVLGGDVLDFLAQSGRPYELVIGARDTQKAELRVNLARYTALNLGYSPNIRVVALELQDVDATAQEIDRLGPDIIFNATTLHSWWVITQLPQVAFQALDRARGGVWTPMHTVLIRKLMQAVRLSGSRATVVNASYPDVVNAALSAEGLAPTVGIGNIANAVPGVRLAAADMLGVHPRMIDVRFFAQHYLSYRMPSTGSVDGAPYHLTIICNGEIVPQEKVEHARLFKLVAGKFRRIKGLAGQSVTASSATAMLRALADGDDKVVHAPGPLGLVGGYPVHVSPNGIRIALPDGLTLDEAVAINRNCQRFDGIESVDADGTVHFTPETSGVLREEMGYDHSCMPLADCEEIAGELASKFVSYAKKFGHGHTSAA